MLKSQAKEPLHRSRHYAIVYNMKIRSSSGVWSLDVLQIFLCLVVMPLMLVGPIDAFI